MQINRRKLKAVLWNSVWAIFHGTVVVGVVSAITTLVMLLGVWPRIEWVFKLAIILTTFGMALTHMLAIGLHLRRFFYALDVIGVILVPLTTPWVALQLFNYGLVHVISGHPDSSTGYFLLMRWGTGLYLIGLPPAAVLFWQFWELGPSDDAAETAARWPAGPRFRSSIFPPKHP